MKEKHSVKCSVGALFLNLQKPGWLFASGLNIIASLDHYKLLTEVSMKKKCLALFVFLVLIGTALPSSSSQERNGVQNPLPWKARLGRLIILGKDNSPSADQLSPAYLAAAKGNITTYGVMTGCTNLSDKLVYPVFNIKMSEMKQGHIFIDFMSTVSTKAQYVIMISGPFSGAIIPDETISVTKNVFYRQEVILETIGAGPDFERAVAGTFDIAAVVSPPWEEGGSPLMGHGGSSMVAVRCRLY
jgi:hypothetical protein